MKKIKKEIPFYSNPDDAHCFQASLKMILKYFWPEEDYSFDELDKITKKIKGLWTWPSAGLIWLKDRGLEVVAIESFDYQLFIQLGGDYLVEEYGKEVGEKQIKNSDIEQERNLARELLKTIEVKKFIPTINDLKKFLDEGYLIICNVNSRKMNRKPGYVGHFVILKGYDKENFIIHDSSFGPNRFVNFELFEEAWAYPNEKAKGIMAFKLKEK